MRFHFPSESKRAVKSAQMTILITLQRKAGCQHCHTRQNMQWKMEYKLFWRVNRLKDKVIKPQLYLFIVFCYIYTYVTNHKGRAEEMPCHQLGKKKKIHQYNWMPNRDPWPYAFWLYWSVRRETQWEFPIGWKNIEFGWWKREWDAE